MSKKVLITGGAGFIGSHVADLLDQKGYEVSVLDNFDPASHPNPNVSKERCRTKFELIDGDVKDLGTLKPIITRFDVICHLAASVGIAQSNYSIPQFVGNNETGTATLLQAIIDTKHSSNLQKFIIASSNTIYGEGLYQCETHGTFHPVVRTEEDVKRFGLEMTCPQCHNPSHPIPTPEHTDLPCNSVYALTKRNQENLCTTVGGLFSFPVVGLRFFNVYGPGQCLSNPYTGVSAIFTSRIKHGNVPIIYEDGKQTRDFVSVHDVARAHLMAIQKDSANNQIFNIGSGSPVTIEDLAHQIAKIYGKETTPKITRDFRKGDIRHCVADISKAKKSLDWSPEVSFKDGLKELVEWSRDQDTQDNFDKAAAELKERGLA